LQSEDSEACLDKVVFACVHNAGRSQMAAAFFNAMADPDRALAVSAGTQPAERIHPVVLNAMREVGIDLASARPQRLTSELAADASLLITMGCGDECPYIPGLSTEDWPLSDPAGQSLEAVRAIREQVHAHVRELVATRGWLNKEGDHD
jgi:arsenate reductase (thioredoxin)